MEPLAISALDPTVLQSRGIDLTTLGAAYLALLGNLVLAIAGFVAARSYLVITPNRASRDYGIYVAVLLSTLLIATALENELLPQDFVTLQYVAVPHLALLLLIHLWIAFRQEPWLIALGGASAAGAVIVVAAAAMIGGQARPAHWLALGLFLVLIAFLWFKSVSTKRGFLRARSIYVASKERPDPAVAPQKPWLGLPQWVALIAASVSLAALNSILRGSALLQIPAVQVLVESAVVLTATALVCAVPAVSYWLARRAWMPELTRFVWLVWLVVGFAFTYGNYLTSLDEWGRDRAESEPISARSP
jgi:hypothetical protein